MECDARSDIIELGNADQVCTLRTVISDRKQRVLPQLVLKIDGPVLHIRRLPISLNGTQAGYRGGNKNTGSRVVKAEITGNVCILLVRSVGSDILLVCTIQNLLVVDPVSGPYRCFALTKRIPCQPDAGS